MSDKRINILLIEDNAGDARLISEMLSEAKRPQFDLERVDRLSAGLPRLAAGGVDVVLLDLSLPDSQGFETFVKLHGQDSGVPILVLTGLDDETIAIGAMQEGAQDYLVKGQVTGSMLARAIRYAIERKHAEQTQQLLAEASKVLAASLDYGTTFDRVACLAVPDLADWCAVHILDEDGMIRRLALAHVDPARAALVRERPERYALDPNAQHLVPQVLRTSRSEIYNEVPDSLLSSAARDAEHLNTLRMLGFKSYICVPLLAHGRTLGAITFAVSESGRRYDAPDLALAEELARRAAVAIENARLYQAAQEEIAERKRAEQALRESHARTRAIVDTALDAIITMDDEGRIVDFNPAAEQIFGHRGSEVIGQQLAEVIIPPNLREQHRRGLARYLSTGEESVLGKRIELTGLRADGSLVHVELSISRMPGGGAAQFTGFLRDITDRKRAEAALQRYTERLKHLREIDQSILSSRSLTEIAQAAVVHISHLIPSTRVALVLVDMAAQTVTLFALQVSGEIRVPPGLQAPLQIIGEALEPLKQGQVYHVTDVAALPELPPALRAAQVEHVRAY
ncbi:MAG TPA: PAS domain S-box protein, partial [Roseiflexaceae bacterium]